LFDDAAFLNYARTLGGVVDEDDHERKLVTAVMLAAPNGPHPHGRAESEHGYFLNGEKVRWLADGHLTQLAQTRGVGRDKSMR
jgi:hypothetical protein